MKKTFLFFAAMVATFVGRGEPLQMVLTDLPEGSPVRPRVAVDHARGCIAAAIVSRSVSIGFNMV